MTKRGKQIFIISVIVSILVLLTLAVYLISTWNNQEIGKSFIIIIIAMLAVLSSIFVYFKFSVRAGFTKQLNQDLYEKYEGIVLALQNTTLSYFEKREVAGDILGILLRGQESGKTADEIICEDTDEYVQKICDSFGKRNRAIFRIISGIQYIISTLTIVQITVYLVGDNISSFYNASINLSLIIYLALLAFVFIPIVKNARINNKPVMIFVPVVILLIAYIAVHELMYRLSDSMVWIQGYLNKEYVFINSFIMAFFWLAVMLSVTFLKKILRKKSIDSL